MTKQKTKKQSATAKVKSVASGKKAKGNAKRDLVCAQGEQCFWVHNGNVIANLVELADVLGTMHGDIYTYHVTKDRNDFADWVEYVLFDPELAKTIRSAKKPSTAYTAVVRRLKIYNT